MSSFALKILACFLMLIDHIGFALVNNKLLLRAIGRLAFPIFAFQTSIGFDKTKNKEKYIIRMLLFTIVSQLPFYLFRNSVMNDGKLILNIGATLTLGLLSLYCIQNIKKPFLKYASILCIILISIIIPMDYGCYGVFMIILFYIFKDNKIIMSAEFSILVIMYCIFKESYLALATLYSLVPILSYNGQKGKNAKYLFYAFYPIHLLVLYFVRMCV